MNEIQHNKSKIELIKQTKSIDEQQLAAIIEKEKKKKEMEEKERIKKALQPISDTMDREDRHTSAMIKTMGEDNTGKYDKDLVRVMSSVKGNRRILTHVLFLFNKKNSTMYSVFFWITYFFYC